MHRRTTLSWHGAYFLLGLGYCVAGLSPNAARAQNLDVSGDVALAFSQFRENEKSLQGSLAPDNLWQGAMALRLGGGAGDLRFFSESAFYAEKPDPLMANGLTEWQLNEAYLNWNIGDFSVIAGRKRTRWGTGLVASPTEIISTAASPISPNDDFFRTQGRDLVQLTYTGVSNSFDVLLIDAEPDARHLEQRALAMRYYVNARGVDLSVLGGVEENGEYVVGANIAFTVGQALELHADVLYDSDARSRRPVISPLGQISFGRNAQASALLGGNWTAPNDMNVIVEYLYFQDGLKNDQVANLVNAGLTMAASGTGDLSLLQSHYLYGRLAKDDVWDAVDIEYNFLKSLENDGYYHALRVSRELNPSSSLFLQASGAGGARTTEFGQYPVGTSLQFGLKASF